MNNPVAGGIAGLVATVPMTVAMEAMHRQLPAGEQYPLPPRQITMNLAEEAGVKDEMSEEERLGATLAAHLAYGTACGAAYSAVAEYLPGPPVLRGIGFGLAVWAGSYLGLLPATGLLTSARHHPRRRNALMITAHIVWGGTAGIIHHALSDERRR